MRYVAIINTPGYLPDTDGELPIFDTPREAWEYLRDEYVSMWDDFDEHADTEPARLHGLARLEDYVTSDGTGYVYTATPGRTMDDPHDQGKAWQVEISDDDE